MSERVVIVGAGHAGGQASVSLRQAGFSGDIVLVGDEPHPPYERPPLSKDLLAGELALERTFLKQERFYAENDVELVTGCRIVALDRAARSARAADGREFAYDRLIIATGTRVRRLDVPGTDLEGVHYLRTLQDTLDIRAGAGEGVRVVVVGGGYIGLEVAASLRKLGADVTVVEMLDRLMARAVAPEISEFYLGAHRAEGVDVRLRTGVAGFTVAEGRLNGVELGGGEKLPADIAVIGIGVVPNAELAAEAGLPVDDGIIVDEYGGTVDPAIYAAGDVTNHPNSLLDRRLRLESVHNAVAQAKAVARAIAGDPRPYAEIPWFWSNQFDLRLQMAGLAEEGDRFVLRGDPASRRFAGYYLRDGRVTAVNAVNSAQDYVQGQKLIRSGRRVDPARLADPSVSLKEL
jgi:3-phenylpropionate/trans-cinnamate dioxygenase ferredoxin reductase subunit